MCTGGCGLVLQENNYSIHSARSSFSPPPLSRSKARPEDEPSLTEIKDLLCIWPHINEGIANVIYARFEKEKEKIKDRKKKIRLLAYITYLELNDAGYSFLPIEIAQLFQLKTSDVFRFQSILTDSSSTCSQIISLSNKYCSLLELSFSDKTKIGQICEALKNRCNANLKSLCMLVIWYYCSKKCSADLQQQPTLRNIAKKCHCNYDNLRRLIKKPFWITIEKEINTML